MIRETRFAIFVYDDVEPIDLGATFGVLSMARQIVPSIGVFTVAREKGPVRLTNGLTVSADYSFENCPDPDVLVVSGGPGWSKQAETPEVLAFVRRTAGSAVVVSACTGAMILAAAGLLDGHRATTKRQATGSEPSPLRIMGERHPAVETVEARLVDDGNIVTGGGVTFTIDTMLHMLARFFGPVTAAETARIMDYEVAWKANGKACKTVSKTD